MRDVRIQSGRTAREIGSGSSRRRSLSYHFGEILRRFWIIRLLSRRLASRGSVTASRIDVDSAKSQSLVADSSGRAASGGNVCSSRKSHSPSLRADGLCPATGSLELAHAAGFNAWNTQTPVAHSGSLFRSGLEAQDHHPVSSSAPNILSTDGCTAKVFIHRLKLANRGDVADFIRTFPIIGGASFLRAVFVDEQCRYLGNELIARDENEIREFDQIELLEAGFRAGATGIILARGIDDADVPLPQDEVAKARRLKALGEDVGIYVLDYLVVSPTDSHGLFAIRKRGAA